MSPLLPNGEHTDYLLKQYDAIQSNCSTSLPVATYGTTLSVVSATATVAQSTGIATTSTTSVSPASTTCLGQLVEPFNTSRSCFNISDTYNVSTGTIIAATGNFGCHFDSPICLPLPCEIDVVWDSPSWYVPHITHCYRVNNQLNLTRSQDLATRYSTESNNITLTQFMAWNPTILGSCRFVNHVQRVCKRFAESV